MVISTSLQACGVVFPFAIPTSICRSNVTICSALYLLIDMTSLPPRKRFSLTSAGTKIPGQVTLPCADCSGILTELSLYARSRSQFDDSTYKLTQTYLGTR